jgi:tRNA modification GTPase
LGLTKKDFEDMPILKDKPCIKVLNKMDLKGYIDSKGFTGISAKTGKNLSLLKSLVVSSFLSFDLSEVVAVNARHLGFVKQGSKAINAISPNLISSNLELVAENLKECDALLGNIYDPISADDLLGKIFNTFCIGK